jgi:hypothetical protein
MRTRWLIDFDECIVPTLTTMVSRLNAEFGTTYSGETLLDLTEFWKSVPEPFVNWMWSPRCFNTPSFLDDLTPHEWSIETIQALLDLRCPVVIATDRPIKHLPWVRKWLAERNVVVPVVSSESRGDSKTPFIEEFKITTVIEDYPVQAAQFLTEPIQKLFVYTSPWNRRVSLTAPAERLDSWADLYERIKEEPA